MDNERKWQLQEAKNKFSQVAEEAAAYGPQVVTKRGKDAVVILSMEDYDRLRTPKTGLVEFLRDSPLADLELGAPRSEEAGREVEL